MSPELLVALEPIFWWVTATGTAALIVLAGPRDADAVTHEVAAQHFLTRTERDQS